MFPIPNHRKKGQDAAIKKSFNKKDQSEYTDIFKVFWSMKRVNNACSRTDSQEKLKISLVYINTRKELVVYH